MNDEGRYSFRMKQYQAKAAVVQPNRRIEGEGADALQGARDADVPRPATRFAKLAPLIDVHFTRRLPHIPTHSVQSPLVLPALLHRATHRIPVIVLVYRRPCPVGKTFFRRLVRVVPILGRHVVPPRILPPITALRICHPFLPVRQTALVSFRHFRCLVDPRRKCHGLVVAHHHHRLPVPVQTATFVRPVFPAAMVRLELPVLLIRHLVLAHPALQCLNPHELHLHAAAKANRRFLDSGTLGPCGWLGSGEGSEVVRTA